MGKTGQNRANNIAKSYVMKQKMYHTLNASGQYLVGTPHTLEESHWY